MEQLFNENHMPKKENFYLKRVSIYLFKYKCRGQTKKEG